MSTRTLTKERRALIRAYLAANPTCETAATARLFGHAKSTILRLKEEVGLHRSTERMPEDAGAYCPTEEQIARGCEEARARRKFREDSPAEYNIPTYGTVSGGGRTRLFEEMH